MKCPGWMGLWLALLAAHIDTASPAVTRKYYIAVQEVLWDYTSGDHRNLLNLLDQTTADIYVKQKADRVGSKYKKALYFQYTDATFSQEIVKSKHLGLAGPVIRGEVGDTLEVHFFNNASFVCSAHPHGLFYLKNSEAALYLDGTSGKWKNDEVVFPGAKVTLVWEITESDAPTDEDPNCIPWVYHSHVNTAKDTSAGLIGTLVTCKKGILDHNNERTDVDADIPLVVKIWDENLSWYMDNNTNMCLDPKQCKTLSNDADADFVESNYMRSINGYMFGHLPNLQACIGKRVAFYVLGMGNEFDIHSLHFHGQNMAYQHTRGDTVSVFSATFVAAEMTPDTAGFWLISDMVDENTKRGMGAFLFTRDCTGSFGHGDTPNRRLAAPTPGSTRTYFLSAEEVTWNYGPTGVDVRTLQSLNKLGTVSHTYFESSDTRIGGTYKKAMFKQYSDSTYSTEVQRSEDEKHMGILGPALRMEVGDTLLVTLRNNVSFDISFLPHALTFAFKQESVSATGGGKVGPHESYTYTFHVPTDLLNGRTEPCHNFLYTSAHDLSRDHHTGLVGPLVVCKKGYLNGTAQSKPKEFFMLLATFDENKSHYIDENIKMNINTCQDKSDEDFQKSNLMLSINGYSFGNLPSPKMCLGDDVTWYAMSVGITSDVHALAFDGNTFTEGGKHRDVEGLVPGSTVALRMTTDSQGTWGVQSQSDYALDNGMFGFYTVDACNSTSEPFNLTGSVRVHYIAAEEVEWDYAPLERSIITGSDLNDPRQEGNIFIKDDDDFIGDVYRKAVYRAYTNSNFTQRKATPQKYRHLDLLGPVIKAEVGDIIEVYFKNLATRPYSMHAQGLFYTGVDSGVDYGQSREVKPGEMKLYTWKVPERSGPAANDPNCIPWLYYSAVDITRDTNSGLQGCIVICRPGTLDAISGDRTDVDSEFFIMMSVMNENFSWYLDQNVKMYAKGRIGTDYSSDPDFEESNKMHAINGRVYGNAPDLVMEYNDTVAWYFLSLGGEIDLHTAHLHGHTVIHQSERHRSDTLQMYPGMAEVVEMVADNPGTWLMHCHQLDHIIAGMETTYTVLQPGKHIPTGGMSPNIHTG